MYLNYVVVFLLAICILSNTLGEACRPSCKTYTYKPYIERIKFLSKLPDSRNLSTLTLIGTHSSLFYSDSVKELQTQDLTIAQQLKYGVRVFDIGLLLQSNILAAHIDQLPGNEEFSDLLIEIEDFFYINPGELIIMLVHQIDPPAKDVTESDCKILDFYIRHVWGGSRIVQNWNFDDTIGQHRGKILIARLDYLFQGCVLDFSSQCKLTFSSELFYKESDYSIKYKWSEIIQTMQGSFEYYSFKCVVNDISHNDGLNSRRAVAKDGGYIYHGFCVKPINYLVAQSFLSPRRGLMIVIADYVTQELIDSVNDFNFHNSLWRIGWE